ncbi:hypothetical protein F8388_024546 [Cannabis sativa]|uniref:Uncharacterized protein n=1 Tax=Cannabis sativa TaxID=3483 RepID=A0A7J6GBC0_CANSA|nr:hypothetical protein F8388_024546 [Cannabis sativa]KAF4398945.1 hypothetical protein G4B88_023539 [Cannabis sativa]
MSMVRSPDFYDFVQVASNDVDTCGCFVWSKTLIDIRIYEDNNGDDLYFRIVDSSELQGDHGRQKIIIIGCAVGRDLGTMYGLLVFLSEKDLGYKISAIRIGTHLDTYLVIWKGSSKGIFSRKNGGRSPPLLFYLGGHKPP